VEPVIQVSVVDRPAIFMWAGALLYVGPGQDTDEHAHHAHQVTVAIRGSARFEFAGHAPLDEAAVLLPAMCRHRQRASTAWVASLYLDPAYEPFTSIGVGPRVLPPDALPSFQDARRWTAALARAAANQIVNSIRGGEASPRPRHDPRIDRVIRAIRREVGRPASAAVSASTIGVSVSRFTHLFSESVGMPFRTYVLWLRLQAVLDSFATRRSLTEAAHDAGFSDAAHLSRTFRRMFGIAPSQALGQVRFVREDDA
jgi:AraC family transcriptional regulator